MFRSFDTFLMFALNMTNLTQNITVVKADDSFTHSVGGQQDDHGCMLGAGYQWCEAHQACERPWLTVCPQIAVDPPPTPYHEHHCPDVMCMMYCPNGHQQDEHGCPMCRCKDKVVHTSTCHVPYVPCQSKYVCPKISSCTRDGIPGYTTYQLSLVKMASQVKTVYALYGNVKSPMDLPEAYQTSLNVNLGGATHLDQKMTPSSKYDSWMTIGIKDGDKYNSVMAIGLNFSMWSATTPLHITDGAIFLSDMKYGAFGSKGAKGAKELVVGQITVPNDKDVDVRLNVQGVTKPNDKRWTQTRVRFHLTTKPEPTSGPEVPKNCVSWYNGCNRCFVKDGKVAGCTRMACFQQGKPKCLSYVTGH
jgi:hypothetical protein